MTKTCNKNIRKSVKMIKSCIKNDKKNPTKSCNKNDQNNQTKSFNKNDKKIISLLT